LATREYCRKWPRENTCRNLSRETSHLP